MSPMHLKSETFNAQIFAHRLLLAASKPSDHEVFRGVRSPNKAAAHLALTAEADLADMPLNHPRVALVRRWIDMSSGVKVA